MISPIFWTCDVPPADGLNWRVYVSEDLDLKGDLCSEVPIADRSTALELPEGVYRVRIVPLSKAGIEGPWRSAIALDLVVTGRERALPALANVAAGPIDPTDVRVVADPPALGDDFHRLQAVQMPAGETEPALGLILGEANVEPAGPMAPNMVRQAGPPIPVEGSGATGPTTRRLAIRAVGPYGSVGAATIRDVAVLDRPGFYRVELAKVAAGVLTGWPALAGTEGVDLDATDGLRLRALPQSGSQDATWGTSGDWGVTAGTRLGLCRFTGAYVDRWTIGHTADVDLGASVPFVLECYAAARRKTATGHFAAQQSGLWNNAPTNPILESRRGLARSTELTGPNGIHRHVRSSGIPREPLRPENVRFQYVAGDAPLSPSEGDWIGVVGGLVLKARYVRVRLTLTEPTGYHQIVVPSLVVTAKVLMARAAGTGSPEGVLGGPPGSDYTDETTGEAYRKASGQGNTGWQGQAFPLVVHPPGIFAGNPAAVTAFNANQSYALYLGRVGKKDPLTKVALEVTQVAGPLIGAEMALCTGAFAAGVGATLTLVSWVDLIPVFGAPAVGIVPINAGAGLAIGTPLWLVLWSDAVFPALPFQFRGSDPDIYASGVFQSLAASRPSAWGGPQVFAVEAVATVPARVVASFE